MPSSIHRRRCISNVCGKQEIHAQQVKYLDTRSMDWNKLMVIRLCSIGLCNGPQVKKKKK